MTTIVATREGIASDSGLIQSKAISAVSAKKIFRIKGHLIGWCGSCAQAAHLIYDLKKAKEKPIHYLTEVCESTYDCGALILDPDGRIWHYDGHGIPFESSEEYATTGSGGTIARAAMMAGASAREAAKIAIALDPQSNGKPKWVRL